MAVEKMKMISAIGCIDDIDMISDEMVKCGCIHVVNAMDDIKRHNPDNLNDTFDYIAPYINIEDYSRVKEQIDKIMEILNIEKVTRPIYINEESELKSTSQRLEGLYEETLKLKEALDKSNEELKRMSELQYNMRNIRNVKFSLIDLNNLGFLKFSMGRMRREYYSKLKENIENVPSIIYEVSSNKNYAYIISFTPVFEMEKVYEIFKSLGYEEIALPKRAKGTPEDIMFRLDELIEDKIKEISRIQDNIISFKEVQKESIIRLYSHIEKHIKMQVINGIAARTNHVFYVSGWIPESSKTNMEKRLKGLEKKLIYTLREDSAVKGDIPPTKLMNNKFVKPFEYLVNMYGTPSYYEIDPTFFVALSYMIMFGAMFGDLGQGFVLFCGGLYLSKVRKIFDMGGILLRVGISSMIFGVLYGSVFGNEEIISPLLISPLENINIVLISGVILGIILSVAGYIFNFINSFKTSNIEEGLFGREGAAGFIFYLLAIYTVYSYYKYGKVPLSLSLIAISMVILLVIMILKQPLTRLIERKRPLHYESPGDYYIEGVFGIIETLLGMLSKTISFVRLGAFALNHVGLFIAFSTISGFMKSKAASTAVLVIGNIIIIGLEGLVVFIQGLRLEYYELFSKFYRGDGRDYEPVRVSYEKK